MTGEEPAALPPVTDPITELTLEMRGLYLVTTRDSAYRFDLRDDHQTVLRIPGPASRPTVNDVLQLVRSIQCAVGNRAYLTFHAVGFSSEIDWYWQHTSTVVRVELLPDSDVPIPDEDGEG
jgi:hypothetical protein